MFNILFKSVFNIKTFIKEEAKSVKSISLSLSDILSGTLKYYFYHINITNTITESKNDDGITIEITTIDAPNSIHITLSPPALPNQLFVMVSLSIEIPVDDPNKPTIRLHAPCSPKLYCWNPRVFDEDKMTEILQDTHDISAFIKWLYKKMANTDAYLIDRNSKRSFVHQDMDDNRNIKYMKMETDE